MNYNFVLSTGDPTISGSLLNNLNRNTLATYSNQNFFFDSSVITGRHASLLSLNSQTLLEETPINFVGNNRDYNYINTGDYYLLPEDSLYSALFNVDIGYPLENTDILSYDQRSFSTGVAIIRPIQSSWTTGIYSITGLRSKVNTIYGDAANDTQLFDKYDIFFNGQKLKQAEYPSIEATGKLFAIKKKNNILDSWNTTADIYGVPFVEDQVDYYINGMEQLESEYLQLYTGVILIKTGVNCLIDSVDLLLAEETLYSL
jgi:hypothetical protein